MTAGRMTRRSSDWASSGKQRQSARGAHSHQGSGFQSNSPVCMYCINMSLPHILVSRRLQAQQAAGVVG